MEDTSGHTQFISERRVAAPRRLIWHKLGQVCVSTLGTTVPSTSAVLGGKLGGMHRGNTQRSHHMAPWDGTLLPNSGWGIVGFKPRSGCQEGGGLGVLDLPCLCPTWFPTLPPTTCRSEGPDLGKTSLTYRGSRLTCQLPTGDRTIVIPTAMAQTNLGRIRPPQIPANIGPTRYRSEPGSCMPGLPMSPAQRLYVASSPIHH